MTQEVQDERASPVTPSGTKPGWHATAERANHYIDPAVRFVKNVKALVLSTITLLSLLAGFGALVTPGGLMCVGLVARTTASFGWDACPRDDEDDSAELAPDGNGEITITVDKKGRLILTGAEQWMARTEVALKLVSPSGRPVTLRKAARTFKTNRHGSLGRHRARVLWNPPARHSVGSYRVLAVGRTANGTKHRDEVVVRVR